MNPFDLSDVVDHTDHLSQFFRHDHLPPKLADVSKHFAELAAIVLLKCPRNFSAVTALRKLLEAKDAAVRAVLAEDL